MAKIKLAPRTLAVVDVLAAGTAVPLSATPLETENILIQAKRTNTGNIFVGDSTVDATNGVSIGPGEFVSLSADSEEDDASYAVIDLMDIYIDAANNNDGVVLISLNEVSTTY